MRECFKQPIGFGCLITIAIAHTSILFISGGYVSHGLISLKIKMNCSNYSCQTKNFTNFSSKQLEYLLPKSKGKKKIINNNILYNVFNKFLFTYYTI